MIILSWGLYFYYSIIANILRTNMQVAADLSLFFSVKKVNKKGGIKS